MGSEIDWNDDESVVRAALPGNQLRVDRGHNNRIRTGNYFWDDWHSARKNDPRVIEFERIHRSTPKAAEPGEPHPVFLDWRRRAIHVAAGAAAEFLKQTCWSDALRDEILGLLNEKERNDSFGVPAVSSLPAVSGDGHQARKIYQGRASYDFIKSGEFQTDGYAVTVAGHKIAECEDSEVADWICKQWNTEVR